MRAMTSSTLAVDQTVFELDIDLFFERDGIGNVPAIGTGPISPFSLTSIDRKTVQRRPARAVEPIADVVPTAIEIVLRAGAVDIETTVDEKSLVPFEPVRCSLFFANSIGDHIGADIVAHPFSFEERMVDVRFGRYRTVWA